MIHTGLPYNIKDMEDIAENGAIVDMSVVKFPGIETIEENILTTFIFLRNTGFSVTLDYSKCSYEMKEQYLISYLRTDINNDQKELTTTWLAICSSYIDAEPIFDSILTDSECKKFISNHKKFVHDVTRYVKSIPVFALYMMSLNNDKIDISDIEVIKKMPAGKNIDNLFFADKVGILAAHEDNIQPAFYEDSFYEKNYELTDKLSSSYLFTILNGFGISKPEDWKLVFAMENKIHE